MGAIMRRANHRAAGYGVAEPNWNDSDAAFEEYRANKMTDEDKGEQAIGCD
jgi:hypothetical protein